MEECISQDTQNKQAYAGSCLPRIAERCSLVSSLSKHPPRQCNLSKNVYNLLHLITYKTMVHQHALSVTRSDLMFWLALLISRNAFSATILSITQDGARISVRVSSGEILDLSSVYSYFIL